MPLSTGLLGWHSVNLEPLVIIFQTTWRDTLQNETAQREAELRGERNRFNGVL